MTVKPSKIPEFKNLEEEAQFWDTHSFTDFEDEFKPVQVHFVRKFTQPITIRFDQATLQTVRDEASKKGIGANALIRMWVYEQISRLKQAHA